MGEFFRAELKDRFLEYALERRDYFEIQSLYDEFLRPNYNLSFVEKLVLEIRDYDSSILDVMSGNGAEMFMLASTNNTQDFLNDGGFTGMFVNEEEKWDVFLNQLAGTRKQGHDYKASLGKKEKSSYKRERFLLFALIFAVSISFLFTVFMIFKSIISDSEKVTKEDLESQLNQMRFESRQKEELLQFEIDELKSLLEERTENTSEPEGK